MKSKQIRISEANYNALLQLCEKLERNKAEVLENLICLGCILAESDAGSVIKIVDFIT